MLLSSAPGSGGRWLGVGLRSAKRLAASRTAAVQEGDAQTGSCVG
jgi:hypothetical protein